jgi:hypothetical protein
MSAVLCLFFRTYFFFKTPLQLLEGELAMCYQARHVEPAAAVALPAWAFAQGVCLALYEFSART